MNSSPRAKRLPEPLLRWGLPSLILLLAFALRLYRLGAANVWWDEALAVWAVRKGLLGVTLWTAADVHPPLYFWCLWAWTQAVGETEFAVRALSVALGVLTVAGVYALATLVAGRFTGSLAALLVSLARFHIWWSQETRMYALAALAGVLSLYLFLRWLRRQTDTSPASTAGTAQLSAGLLLALYTLASIAAIYSILLMGALILAQNLLFVWVLVRSASPRRARLLGRWVLAQLAIVAALAVWLAVSWGRMRSWSVSEPFRLATYVQLIATLFTTGISVDIQRYLWLVPWPFALLLVGLFLLVRTRGHDPVAGKQAPFEALALALASLIPLAAVYLATLPGRLFYTPRIEARYLLPFAPPFWILLAWSIQAIRRRWRLAGSICLGLLLVLSVAVLPGYYRSRVLHDELQTMVQTVASQAQPGDVVVLDSGDRYPLWLYYYAHTGDDASRPDMVQMPYGASPLTAERAAETLAPLAEEHARIWLAEVEVAIKDPDRQAYAWLQARTAPVASWSYGYNTLYLFDAKQAAPTLNAAYIPQYPLAEAAGTGGQLLGWELPVDRFTSGDTIRVALLWERLPAEPVAVSLRTPQGQVLETRSVAANPGAEDQRQQFDFTVYGSTPAGWYDIVLSPAPASGAVLGRLRVAGTEALPQVGEPDVSVGARLGEQIELVGYSLRGSDGRALQTLQPGESLTLDLYWRCDAKLEHDYVVFTHLLGQAYNPATQGPVWGQHDSQPANGGYPSTQWLVGTVWVDRHVVELAADAPAGEYQIEVGLYTPEDGVRLAVHSAAGEDGGDRVLLSTQVHVQ